jgi:hypothetical protein
MKHVFNTVEDFGELCSHIQTQIVQNQNGGLSKA